MLPLDDEFLIIYSAYFLLFSYMVYGIIKGKRLNKIGLTSILLISLSLNLYLYLDPDNFKGGGSLGVWFYSWIIFLLTLIITIIYQLFVNRRYNENLNKRTQIK
ncbi:hypothetical protein EDF66_101324 [Sphingobacterium sp. JUb20]|nr:hypothetical protein [Sphingobacterium sp. JUb21]TCR10510.1 hypothetical protein EDF66_101324 [Sphingobacterium sp. JUb20]